MSDSFDKKQTELEQQVVSADENVGETTEDLEESTVFSAPAEHKYTSAEKTPKKRLASIIAACLAVAVLVGGTLAVIKLIPEMKGDEAPESIFEDITVIDANSETFSAITIKNSNGEFNFTIQQVGSNTQSGETTSKYWTVDGIDYSKLSTTSVNTIISSISNIIATKEVNKPASECGFDNPSIKVSVQSSATPYTFMVGDKSPDGLGYYLTVEGQDKVYIAPSEEFTDLGFSLLSLTDRTNIPAVTFTVDTSENKVADGTYAYFDSLVLSGKNYPTTLTIINTPASTDTSSVTPYMITTPMERFANTESLTPLIYLFSQEMSVIGNYAIEINDQTLQSFGLDNPDIAVTLTIKGESKTFKMSKVDDSSYAVIYDGATMIRKVAASDITFLNYTLEDYYHKSVCFYPRTNVKNLAFTDSEISVEFDIAKETDDNGNDKYTITSDSKDIKESDFMDLYRELLSVQCSDFVTDDTLTNPDAKISLTFFSGNKARIEFYKTSELEYQYNINGIAMGRIPASTYTKIAKNFKVIAEGGSIS